VLRPRGFSLIETMIALVVVSVLAGLAYPSFLQLLRKARRGDAIVALLDVQQAQERWRANAPSYGTLEELGIAATTDGGAYRLSIAVHDPVSYAASAEAVGKQASDTACRFLELAWSGGYTAQASGPDADVRNDHDANRRCWNR
jgi:type IV pilus assembly protein PilE